MAKNLDEYLLKNDIKSLEDVKIKKNKLFNILEEDSDGIHYKKDLVFKVFMVFDAFIETMAEERGRKASKELLDEDISREQLWIMYDKLHLDILLHTTSLSVVLKKIGTESKENNLDYCRMSL